MKHLVGLLAFGSLTISAVASAQPATAVPALTPSSQWQVEYADEECRLVREFGSGNDLVVLRLARSSSRLFDFVVAGPGIPDLPLRRSSHLRLSPQSVEIESTGYSMQVPDQSYHFVRLFDIDAAFLAQLRPGQLVTFRNGDFSVTLRLDNIVGALAAMQSCNDGLLTRWGYDVARVNSFTRQATPIGDQARWVTTDDYPRSAVSVGQTGIVTTFLTIGIDGRVTSCRVVVSSRVPELDSAACEAFVRRARFAPALGPDGQPTEAPYIKRVRWQLPDY